MAASSASRIQTDLKPETLGLVSVTMQAITHLAPAIAALFFTQFLVTLSGVTAPLAYLLGVLIVLMLGNTLIQFSRQLPSAGGDYTYVSRALGSRAGFLTAWLVILYSPMAGGVVSGFFGFIAAGELKASYGWDVPWLWWLSVIVMGSIVAALQYRGIELTARTLLITGGAEIVIVLALAFTGFASSGPGGISLAPFNPGNIGAGTAFGLSGFTLAIVLAVQGLTGWEAAAPLAEETKDPKRNVPRSVLLSIIILGVFLVFTYWGIITGFGVDNIKGIIGSPDLPGLALARNVGVFVYYWRERRSEFNWLWHAILPVVSGLVLIYALAESFPPFCPSQNCPVDPYAKAPLVAGGWLLIGILLLVYYAANKRDQWLKTAGAALGESEDDLAMARVTPAGASAKV